MGAVETPSRPPDKSEIQLPAPVIDSQIPDEVTFGPGVESAETARPFFDYFSWQSFVALNWPAAIGADGKAVRGVPSTDSAMKIGNPGVRVWESYKTDWELFRPGGKAPTPWSSYDLPLGSPSPCGDPGESKTLAMVTKMDSVLDGINQAFSHPLVDQNRNYVRYEIHVNQPYYQKVVDKQWYRVDQQSKDPSNPNEFPNRVIEIKAAWKELVAGTDDPSRFYTTDALIFEPAGSPKCRSAKMGLIGFHIANKEKHHREWIWSTFEHVDNVPEGTPVSGLKYSLHNGTNIPSSLPGYDHRPEKINETKPFPVSGDLQRNPVQVSRLTPLSDGQVAPTTEQMNAKWQQALAGTVWQFYKLVSTQWPIVQDGQDFKVGPPGTGTFPKNSDSPFPAAKVANSTMETYVQKNSCMKCHYLASQDDFSFLLSERAFTPPPPVNALMTAAKRAKQISDDRISKSPILQSLRAAMLMIDKETMLPAKKNRRQRR